MDELIKNETRICVQYKTIIIYETLWTKKKS